MKSLSGYLRTRKLKARLEKPPVVVRTMVSNVEIAFAVHTWLEYHNRARDSYTGEPDTVAWIEENTKGKDTLWDIGANVGAYSLFAAKTVPAAAVVAFEPYIPTFSHLWDNIVLNGCGDCITPLCLALSDSTGLSSLGISDPRAGSSEHVLGGKDFGLKQPSFAIRGDDAADIMGMPYPNLIKIDVDGYEVHVLKGMKKILQNEKLRSLIIEVEKDKTEESVSELLSRERFMKIAQVNVQASSPVYSVVYRR